MTTPSREGLFWDDSGPDVMPEWTSEPSLEAVQALCRRVLKLGASDDCSVSFKAAGGFNRVYFVENNCQQRFVLRASLPIDPHHKTAGEVATLRWLWRHSDIPAPKVIAFDYSSDNEIGYEWILMQLMPGTSAYFRWRKMSMEAKKTLVEKIAEYQAQFFNQSAFRTIGTLKDGSLTTGPNSIPGRLVSLVFCWGEHFDYDVPRGPFRSSHDWLEAVISMLIQDKVKEVGEAEDDEEKKDSESDLRTVRMLADLLPKIFPSVQNPPERTVMWHNDLCLQNIMVDDEGAITAIIDWECISTMPVWYATRMPEFLVGQDRNEEPCRDGYGDAIEGDAESQEERSGEDFLDSEGKSDIYWEHLMEYESTQLRKVYSDRMSQLWPAWNEAVAERTLKADFYESVQYCIEEWQLGAVKNWIEAVNKGEFPRLADMLPPGIVM
ncbi:hypothetical protein ACHAPT_005992 [Fusarium lateritium]